MHFSSISLKSMTKVNVNLEHPSRTSWDEHCERL